MRSHRVALIWVRMGDSRPSSHIHPSGGPGGLMSSSSRNASGGALHRECCRDIAQARPRRWVNKRYSMAGPSSGQGKKKVNRTVSDDPGTDVT